MVEKRKLYFLFFFSKIAPRWGQIGQSYLALGRAKLRKSSKVEFIGANSDFGGVEMVPVPPVLAQIVQNEPWWAKLALEKLEPIWLLGSIWLFSFYSAAERNYAVSYWRKILHIRQPTERNYAVSYWRKILHIDCTTDWKKLRRLLLAWKVASGSVYSFFSIMF